MIPSQFPQTQFSQSNSVEETVRGIKMEEYLQVPKERLSGEPEEALVV